MKFILKILLIALFTYLIQLVLPWWGSAIAAFVGSIFIDTKGFSSYMAGFIAVFLLWSIKAYYIDVANEQILSHKVAMLFSVTPTLLIAITGVIGGVVGAFAALTGTSFVRLFQKSKINRRNKYYV